MAATLAHRPDVLVIDLEMPGTDGLESVAEIRRRWIDQDVSAAAIVDDCPLTDRELDVLRVTHEGYSVAEIADRMHLAHGTVRNHPSSALQKTQTRHEAARYAHEHDWL